MDTNRLRDNWPEIKKKLQSEHPQLTNEDLVYEIGKEAELLKRLQEKLRMNREEMNNWLSIMG